MSDWQQTAAPPAALGDPVFECIALCPEHRAILHARIERRLDDMFEAGLIGEVTTLHERGDLHTDLPAIRAVGYRQVWSFLQGEISLEECREKALAATRQLAKRQITWLRGWPALAWVLTDAEGQILPPRADDEQVTSTHPLRAVWKNRIMEVMQNF